MLIRKKTFVAVTLMLLVFTFAAPKAEAKGGGGGNEYKSIVNHLKTKYKAKKVKIPFLWLARVAVSVVRPAGVKSFSVTLFEGLKFSRETLDQEMQSMMRNSFSPDWDSILRVRSREGEQVYMYMREVGKSVRLAIVTIDKEQAAVIRATVNPEKLAEFINDPKIFGISLNDNQQAFKNGGNVKPEDDDKDVDDEKKEQPKKDN
jgi:hypothetical protein